MTRTVTEGDAWELLSEVPDDYGHCAVIDYPWYFDRRNGSNRFGYESDDDDDVIFASPDEGRFQDLCDELVRVLVDGAWVLAFADDRFQDPVRDTFRATRGLTFRRNWAWTPETIGMGYYGRVNHYPIPTATVGPTERYVKDRGTLYQCPGGRQTSYPTGKPVRLYEDMLQPPVLRSGERVLEPFCGFGPAAAVAVARDCAYWGCDINGEAIETVADRLESRSFAEFEDD